MKASFINHNRSACLVLFLEVCKEVQKASTTKDYYFIFSLLILNYPALYFTIRLLIFFHRLIMKKSILKFQDFFIFLNAFFQDFFVCFWQTSLKNQSHCYNINQIKNHKYKFLLPRFFIIQIKHTFNTSKDYYWQN